MAGLLLDFRDGFDGVVLGLLAFPASHLHVVRFQPDTAEDEEADKEAQREEEFLSPFRQPNPEDLKRIHAIGLLA